MEYLPGLSLAQFIERHGPLPAERVVYLLDMVSDQPTGNTGRPAG